MPRGGRQHAGTPAEPTRSLSAHGISSVYTGLAKTVPYTSDTPEARAWGELFVSFVHHYWAGRAARAGIPSGKGCYLCRRPRGTTWRSRFPDTRAGKPTMTQRRQRDHRAGKPQDANSLKGCRGTHRRCGLHTPACPMAAETHGALMSSVAPGQGRSAGSCVAFPQPRSCFATRGRNLSALVWCRIMMRYRPS